VLTTHRAQDAKVTRALETLAQESFLVGAPVRIRMEE
jgi:hypothetical protein